MHIASANIDNSAILNDYTRLIGVGIQFAFQPLVNLSHARIAGYEALVRGHDGQSAGAVIAGVRPENLALFDQACRSRALQDAARIGVRGDLHLNCTEVTPDNLAMTIDKSVMDAENCDIAPNRVVLEFSSLERLGNPRQLAAVRQRANAAGFRVLADNFGLGEAGLKRLVVFQPEFIKLDRELCSNIDRSQRRQAMVLGIIAACRSLNIEVIASGIERAEEVEWLHEQAGVDRFQGYFFARPQLMAAPSVDRGLLDND